MSRAAFEKDLVFEPGTERAVSANLVDGALRGSLGDVPVRRIDGNTVAFKAKDGRWVRATVKRIGDATWVVVEGDVFIVRDADAAAAAGGDASAPFAMSPMTGVVAKVSVEVGQEAAEGQELFIVEAMKMEYVVRAPRAVVVDEVRAVVGASVELGEVLVTFGDEA